MRIAQIRLVGLRCFDDTTDLRLAEKFNIIVGQNNSGKSTLLKGVLQLQGMGLDGKDVRPLVANAWLSILLGDLRPTDILQIGNYQQPSMRFSCVFLGNAYVYNDYPIIGFGLGQQIFHSARPHHHLVPFIAKRKASGFNEVINAAALTPVTGTLQNLYSNIDLLATDGHPNHEAYKAAVHEILGLRITTQPSNAGKVAGFYLDADNFITLDRMGDGVAEIVALITELCLARNKIFVLEEPETNLHPKGLKALLNLVRTASADNQFIIATHSNVVVRELGGEEDSKVFGVYRDGDTPNSPSRVEEVERTPAAHMQLLRELGYEFTDFSLHEGWLFLEESSAERIVRDILIPSFVPKLKGRLRTFSAAGVDNLEPTVAEFRRLITFVHLQPVYDGRIWVRADGDAAGTAVIAKMQDVFPNLDVDALACFEQPQFEHYYPAQFADAIVQALEVPDKRQRREAKATLLNQVVEWTSNNVDEAKAAWAESADEVIKILKVVAKKIG
jgi:predicted ATPase